MDADYVGNIDRGLRQSGAMPVPVALGLRVFRFLLSAVVKGGSQEGSDVRLRWCPQWSGWHSALGKGCHLSAHPRLCGGLEMGVLMQPRS